MPRLDLTWRGQEAALRAALCGPRAQRSFSAAQALDDFTEVVSVIKESEPRLLRQYGFPADYETDIGYAGKLADSALEFDFAGIDPNEAREESARLGLLASAIHRLGG